VFLSGARKLVLKIEFLVEEKPISGGQKMSVISMKQLLESGAHFGHQAKRWNPKMKRYIFTERNGIHILDLHKTIQKVEKAYEAVKEAVADGGICLFVGTKKQASEAVKTEALRAGMFYVDNRWLGGMLTNHKTIAKRIERLKAIEKMQEDGTLEALPKKEAALILKELAKLKKNLDGIKDMPKLPSILFIVDTKKETLAIAEAKKLGIPVVGMIDTNADPDEVDYVIPANDDAIRSVALIARVVANACIEANQGESFETEEVAVSTEEVVAVEEVVVETVVVENN